MELNEFPKVELEGSEDYWSGYEFGEKLNETFPDQECVNFGSMLAYNEYPSGLKDGIIMLKCLTIGEHDGESWVWMVTLADGRVYKVTGWCDYTGWDCQSGSDWELVFDIQPHKGEVAPTTDQVTGNPDPF